MRGKRAGARRFQALGVATVFAFALFWLSGPLAMAKDAEDAQGIVDNARVTFGHFMRDSNYQWFHSNLDSAKGLLIYPQVLKAGFFLGGSGGTGVLVARDPRTGEWSQPAFYTLGSVSFGLQFGGEASETIVMVMTQKALDSLFTSNVKLGGDASVAAGPVGTGAKANVTADFVSFSMAKGLFAGVSLEGAVVGVRGSLNQAYYGRSVTPMEIIVEKKVSNKGSSDLLAAIRKGAR